MGVSTLTRMTGGNTVEGGNGGDTCDRGDTFDRDDTGDSGDMRDTADMADNGDMVDMKKGKYIYSDTVLSTKLLSGDTDHFVSPLVDG